MPQANIRFLPCMSAILPNGTRNTAAARRYEVATQLSKIASIENSLPIKEDPIKGVTNEATVATINAAPLLTSFFMLFSLLFDIADSIGWVSPTWQQA